MTVERACGYGEREGDKIEESRGYQRGILPRVASQHSRGEKEEWEMAGLLDFTDLNKACPKDPFPMPQID